MRLNKIILNDFGIYGGHNEFNLNPERGKPIILFVGVNGAGKTTLFESVLLCLYGRNAVIPKIKQKQYREKIMKLFHRYTGTKKNAEEASVTLEFQYAHGGKVTEYKITRMWQNNSGYIDETLHISKKREMDENFTDLDIMERSEWQVFVNHMLPRGIADLFFFDGEKIQKIAESGQENVHIKSSFDALLGLDLVNQLYDDMGLYLLRNSDTDTKVMLDEIERKTDEKREAETKLENLHEKEIFLDAEIGRIRKEVAVEEEKFLKLGGHFAQKRQKITEDRIKLESELDVIEGDIHDICDDILPLCLVADGLLGQVCDELKSDTQKIQDDVKRNVLGKVFNDVTTDIKSILSKYDTGIREEILEQVRHTLDEKITSISGQHQKTTLFNLTPDDMKSMIHLINNVGKNDLPHMKKLTGICSTKHAKLNQIKSMLDVAPLQDEIGPMFSEIMHKNREIGELEKELDTLKNLEAQEKSFIILTNSAIRQKLAQQKMDKKILAGLELVPKIQDALDDFAQKLRQKKVSLLESNILDGMKQILHKKDFVTDISVNPETFEVTLYRAGSEVTRDMMSQGELQVYATAIVWGVARTSKRPLPFIIDTPLARLDIKHRENLINGFYPYASHQIIIFSTDSEIIEEYYDQLKPYISHSIHLEYDAEEDRTIKNSGYFVKKGKENENAKVR